MANTYPQDAVATYNIQNWGEGYFNINTKGEVSIKPQGKNSQHEISFTEVVAKISQQGLKWPVLARFPDILQHRTNCLCNAFNEIANQLNYTGHYTAVYPIKVNQQRRVVEEILRAEPASTRGQIGLEAGSKPELIVVLANSSTATTIICNGYKDREYIRLALIGQLLGHQVYIVVEKPGELQLILDEGQRLGVAPVIGIRAKLASIGKGNWQNTGGEKSKFGLSSTQILQVIDTLREHNQLVQLKLLHFHLGSQIANIRDIQTGLKECARFYGELRCLGASIEIIDVGGGLGVDYEGTRSRSACSVNYSLHEYAFHVLRTLKDECDLANLPHPDVISESGRAMTAHHAVLITNIIDQEQVAATATFHSKADANNQSSEEIPVLRDLQQNYQDLSNNTNLRSYIEIYHDAAQSLEEAQNMFIHGILTLKQRSAAERLHHQLCRVLQEKMSWHNRAHRDILDDLNEKLADKIFVNFSLFQSLPDAWGIDQVFPVLPLTNLDKPLTRRGVIQDITCDSDGRIDFYVDDHGVDATLPMPEVDYKKQLLGFFLVGAYQEILGDMHNMFGDTNSVDVFISQQGEVDLKHPICGDTVDIMLRYVNFNSEQILNTFKEKIHASGVNRSNAEIYLDALHKGLSGYTYLAE